MKEYPCNSYLWYQYLFLNSQCLGLHSLTAPQRCIPFWVEFCKSVSLSHDSISASCRFFPHSPRLVHERDQRRRSPYYRSHTSDRFQALSITWYYVFFLYGMQSWPYRSVWNPQCFPAPYSSRFKSENRSPLPKEPSKVAQPSNSSQFRNLNKNLIKRKKIFVEDNEGPTHSVGYFIFIIRLRL